MKKDKLRKKYKTIRDSIDKETRILKSKQIIYRLENLDFFKYSENIFSYINFNSEVITVDFIKKYIYTKNIIVPKIIMNEMSGVKIDNINNLKKGTFNILEPESNEKYRQDYDIIICPGLAFDKNLFRLGYGKGFFDRFLTNVDYKYSVGLFFQEQYTEYLPVDRYDKKLDIIITDEKIYN